jgi:hypothetical protein
MAALPEPARAHAVALLEDGVEPAQALEPAGERHLRHRQRRVGQQALGQEQPVRLRQLDRRDAELALHRTPELALAHAQLARQEADAASVERSGRDAHRRRSRHTVDGIHQRPPRCQLGPAPETGPKAVVLGGRGRCEKPAAIGVRHPRRADGTAVDHGRADAHEEDAVEPRVA